MTRSDLMSSKYGRDTPYYSEMRSESVPEYGRETPYSERSESIPYKYGRESSYDSYRERSTESTWESPEYMTKSSMKYGFPEEEGEESMWDDSVFSKWESSYKKFDWTRDFTAMTPTSNIDKVS